MITWTVTTSGTQDALDVTAAIEKIELFNEANGTSLPTQEPKELKNSLEAVAAVVLTDWWGTAREKTASKTYDGFSQEDQKRILKVIGERGFQSADQVIKKLQS